MISAVYPLGHGNKHQERGMKHAILHRREFSSSVALAVGASGLPSAGWAQQGQFKWSVRSLREACGFGSKNSR
jgi:hypothetical protein